MLLPFRSASNHFMSIDGNDADNDNDNDDDRFSSPMSISSLSDQEELCTPPLYAENQVQLRQRRMRSQSDLASNRRKRASSTASSALFQPSSLSSRLIGFLVMFLFFILFLGILMPSATPIDADQMHIRYLWSMPWFGGWRIQVLAVQR